VQRIILTSALGLAAGALAVSVLRTPAQQAQATPATPAPELAPSWADPVPVVPIEATDGLASRASMDRWAHRLNSPQERFLVVEVQAPEVSDAERLPLHLAVVMDRSGSMEGESIANAKRAATRLVQRLNPADSFAMVGFAADATTTVPREAVWDRERIAGTIDGVRAGGNTNLYAGLAMGIGQLAGAPEGNRRVVLLSDGITNTGETRSDIIASLAAEAARSGITVSALGLGVEFDGELLHALSDAGGGSYLYAGRSTQLVDSFEGELDRAFTVAARDTRVELALHDGVEVLEVYGYEEWDGKATEEGFEAYLGDLSAHETRKVVVRARVPAEQELSLEVAQVRVSWEDPATGERLQDLHEVALTVTDDVAAVREARVPWAAVHAATAEVGRHMQWAGEAWNRGELETSTEILDRGGQRLAQLTRGIDDARIDELHASMSEQKHRYRTTRRDTFAGKDLHISEGLRALGYLN